MNKTRLTSKAAMTTRGQYNNTTIDVTEQTTFFFVFIEHAKSFMKRQMSVSLTSVSTSREDAMQKMVLLRLALCMAAQSVMAMF
jgi:hypothetical protein